MDDAELEYWGRYGRMVNSGTVLLTPPGHAGDILQLWNVVGALEEKVRNASQ